MSKASKFASATLNPRHQSLESLHKLVGEIVSRGGCRTCGLIAVLRIDFLGDPPPELGEGVISFSEGGMSGG